MPTIAPVSPPGALRFSPDRLRALRSIRNMSQREVGERIGRTQSLIAAVEQGKALPSAQVLGALAYVLGCTVDAMYEVPGEAWALPLDRPRARPGTRTLPPEATG